MEQSSSRVRKHGLWSDSASATSNSSLLSSLSTEPSETSLPLLLIDGPQRDDVVSFDNESFSPYEPSDWNEDIPKPIPLKRTLHELEEAIQQYGPNHVKVASLWSALGLIRHHMQHLTAAAVKCHRAAIDIYRQHDNCKVDLAVALTDLGRCYEYLHESDKSVLLYREAAATLESEPTHQQSCFCSQSNELRRVWSVVESFFGYLSLFSVSTTHNLQFSSSEKGISIDQNTIHLAQSKARQA